MATQMGATMLIRVFVLLALLLPSVSHAATYWDDGFNAQNANWDRLDDGSDILVGSGVIQIDTSVAHAGAGSVKYVFDFPSAGSCLPGHANFVGFAVDCGGGFIRSHTETSTLWRRWWIRLSPSFVVGTPITKITKSGANGWTDWIIMQNGQTQLTYANQGFPDAGTTNNLVTNGWLQRGVWQCMEVYMGMNTPGVANGTLIMYLDEAVIYNSNSVGFRRTGDNTLPNFVEIYRQYGQGSINIDDYAVGDTRMGCGSAPPPPVDTTPPTVPTLSATAGNATVQLSWTASSDGSGIQRYNIQRSTTASGGPYTALSQVTGSVTSYQDTTVSNGTTYYYQVSATDAASSPNTSAFSTYASATPAAPGGASATTITITPTGRIAFNGVTALLKCVSFYDISNYHTADIDALAADGVNCLIGHADDVLRNDANSLYNNDGSLKAGIQTDIEAAIDYADSKGMAVLLNCTYADTDGFNSAAWLTSPSVTTAIGVAITNCINAFEANGNVLFSIVNEHNYGSYADTHTEMATWMTTARAACATCLIGFSSSDNIGVYPADGHLFTTRDGATVNSTNVEAELALGPNFLLWHDDRTAGFSAFAQARASAMRSYLDNNGHQNIPFIGDEPAREGSGGLGAAASWLAYYQALVNGGIQGIALHNDASFDMDPATFLSQVDAVEQAVMDGLAAALASSTTQTRAAATITDTFDRADGALGANWDDAYTGASSLTISSNAVFANSTTLDSIETNNTATLAANAWGSGTIGTWTGSGVSVARIGLRWSASPTVTGVFCTAARNIDGTRTTQIEQFVNGVYSELAHNGNVTWASSDELSCEVVGTSVTAYRQAGGAGDPVAVATGTTTISGTGRGAVLLYNGTASEVSFTGVSFGEFAAPVAITTPQILTLSSTTAGATFTYSGSLASIDACTFNGCINYPLASTPSGVITYNWLSNDSYVCVYAIDPNGARNNTDYVCAPVTSAADVTAPTIYGAGPSGVLIAGTASTTVFWNTTEASTCKLNTTDVAYASMSLSPLTPPTGETGLAFTYLKSGLANSTTYHLYVACSDPSGNISATTHITFSVETPASVDTTPPTDVTNLAATVLSTSQIRFTWTAATDLVALSTANPYRLYFCGDATCATKTIQATSTDVSVTVGGLTPGQTVYATVRAVDSSNNESAANSNIVTATTQPIVLIDVVPPSDPGTLTITPYARSAMFQWPHATDDQAGIVTTLVELCSGSAACTAFTVATPGTTTADSLLVTGLTPSTIYRGRIIHLDLAGNPSANYSSRVTFTTPAATGNVITQPRAPVSFGQPRLPRN